MYTFFGRQFSPVGTTPTFLWQIVTTIYCAVFDKSLVEFVCWCPSAKPDNEVECV